MLYQTKNPHGGDIYGGGIRWDFSANTNPLGTPPGVLQAVQGCLTQLHRYPDPYCRELVQAISQFESVPASWVFCGSGAAELIYSYCRCIQAQKAVELAPTFSEYSLALEQSGCQVSRYRLHKESGFLPGADFLAFLQREKPQVLFLCNPNNPTGRTLPPELMEIILAFCAEENIRLFVDECFADLSDHQRTLKPALAAHPNVFLLKAFTKSYGMAGLRLGYCLCSDEALLAQMAKTVQPWNISTPAQAAGLAALKEDAFLRKTRQLIAAQRRWLTQQLEALGLWVCPSEANYLLFQGPEGLDKLLRQEGIALRSCGNYHGLCQGWYRTAVRLQEENTILIQALSGALGKEVPWQKTL